MADGAARSQREFHFPRRALVSALRAGEIVVDLFAGGGGASEALRQALGRDPDICINHDAWAIGMHAANHPFARHLCEDVWAADPRAECAGRAVGWLHASPDCTHFSQAKGGQPRSRATRSLSWVVLKWAGAVRPRIISLENVEQIQKWGPLVAKRDRATGRALRLDGSPAAPGEHLPIGEQFLLPDKRHEGRTWRHFIAALRALGYSVEWRKVRACDYGAGTSRTRLFLVARCDGEPIRWPEPTHGPERAQPFVTAADCIDWSIPCPSIFQRKKPLADATMRRIARGIRKFVLDAAEPFIVPNNTNNAPKSTSAQVKGGHFAVSAATLIQASHGEGSGATQRRGSGAHDIEQPVGTIHAGGGSFALSSASLVKFRGDCSGSAADAPVPTITSGAGASRPAGCAHALGVMTAFLEQANGSDLSGNPAPPRAAAEPMSTITSSGSQQRIVAAHLTAMAQNVPAVDPEQPLPTILAGATRFGAVECALSPDAEAGALRVAAFLLRYYSEGGQWGELSDPLDTITTRDRLALVTIHVRGIPHVIVDIGLRMLRPPELYRAQGFPSDYIIDRTADGRAINGTRSVRMVGNSVSPPPLAAIARANLGLAVDVAEAA